MKKICNIILSVILLVSISFPVYANSAVPEAVISATESVVRVLAEYSSGYSTGSGFVIKSNEQETLIVTNYHVVEGDPYGIAVWLSEEETVSATIVAYTNQKDLCILKLAYPVSMKPLTFSAIGAKQGEAVYAVGYPGAADKLSDKEAHTSADATITDGIVSATREVTITDYGTPTSILQMNAAVNPGNSGGPLFNIAGEVVGINTYGINDAQGIFGAIDISELDTFLADNSITLSKNKNAFSWIYVVFGIGVAIVIAGIIILIRVVRRKMMKKTANREELKVPLREYMEAYPDGLGINGAVAMLLPVALKLRDLHNDGKIHLQVSPNTICVGSEGAWLADATAMESDRYVSGYAAPEIYKGISAGNLSDVYSFFAVLFYVISGKQPPNALSRMEESNSFECLGLEDSVFGGIISTGMKLEAFERISSMQDVIIKLSPYNTQKFENTHSQMAVENKGPAKKKIKRIIIPIAIGVSVIIALVGTYFGCYAKAQKYAQNGEFSSVNSVLVVPQITKLHDPQLIDYVDAGNLLADRKYEDAKRAFEKLSGYMNADELALEADYRRAEQYADANKYEEAFDLMTELSDKGYKDAETKLLDFKYRKGVYLLQEEGEYQEANKIFTQLIMEEYDGAEDMKKETLYRWGLSYLEEDDYIKAYNTLDDVKGYANVDSTLNTLEFLIYSDGQELYRDKKYLEAKTYFSCIESYADSQKYLTLIDTRYNDFPDVDDLIDIFYFEDTAEILLSNDYLATEFLRGSWKGYGYYFTIDEDGYASYNLPWFDYGDYYRIENGQYMLYPDNDRDNTRKMFEFTALDPDTVTVFCYKNSSTYILYRQ